MREVNSSIFPGEQAAYRAYQKFMADQGKTELRLPGLEQFSPKQARIITFFFDYEIISSQSNLPDFSQEHPSPL